MKAIIWHDESLGAEYEVEDIPLNFKTKQRNGAARCLSKLLSVTKSLMEKYFEDPMLNERRNCGSYP